MEWRAYILLVVAFLTVTVLAGLLVRHYERPYDGPDLPIVITRKIENETFGNRDEVESFVTELLDQLEVDRTDLVVEEVIEENNQTVDKFINVSISLYKKVKWDYYGAIFYSLTVITTIGYGQTSPITPEGRLISALYPIVGIPLLVLTVSTIGEFMVEITTKRLRQIKIRKFYRIYFLIIEAILLTIIGSGIFLLLPSILFMYMEDWSYLNAYYYAFMTLTTIGLGDLAAGYRDDAPAWYRVFICIWIMLGMGWESFIIAYLMKILRVRAETVIKKAGKRVTGMAKRMVPRRRQVRRTQSYTAGQRDVAVNLDGNPTLEPDDIVADVEPAAYRLRSNSGSTGSFQKTDYDNEDQFEVDDYPGPSGRKLSIQPRTLTFRKAVKRRASMFAETLKSKLAGVESPQQDYELESFNTRLANLNAAALNDRRILPGEKNAVLRLRSRSCD